MRRGALAGLLLWVASGSIAAAQSWRLRFDAAAQRVSFRGLSADSIPERDAVTGPSGGPTTADGYAVSCFGDGFCRFYRPGPIRRGLPASATVDLSMWGLGLTGLRIRVNARTLTDLTGERLWPGTSPAFRLIEGYAELARGGFTGRVGRTLDPGRLGGSGAGGLDGMRASWRFDRVGIEIGGYLGWGLARGTVLSVTSPAVNPLAEFQPEDRQVVAGGILDVRAGALDAGFEYRREVDPAADYFVSERAAFSFAARPHAGWLASGGVERDLAEGRWGSADAQLGYSGNHLWITASARRYRPFFDLWTVWGAFSPVAFTGLGGSLAIEPQRGLKLRARGEWFRFDDTETNTPQVVVEDRGWRWGLEMEATPRKAWRVAADAHGEFLPGAASRGLQAQVAWQPSDPIELVLRGGSLERPLELRFQDAGVTWLGLGAGYRAGDRWRFDLSAEHYWESGDRPDTAAFDWNQWRMHARVSLVLRSMADRWVLPPGRLPPESR